MQDFSELERLMEETNRMPVSDFDKNSLAKLGAEVKKNSVNIETYKDLVKFTKSIETLLWVSKNVQNKTVTGRAGI
ncbi:hypothetical protein ACI1UM_06430 [Lactococcus petauri]|uniref:hypothetical protein n=1 Tax=Lactococcus petauri TaxID=1940789 RepID=UPI0038537B69